MNNQPIPADLMALHAQIQECEAEGFKALAGALRIMLARQMHERGIAPATFEDRPPMTGAARDLWNLFSPRQP